jgi:hypothetical protein
LYLCKELTKYFSVCWGRIMHKTFASTKNGTSDVRFLLSSEWNRRGSFLTKQINCTDSLQQGRISASFFLFLFYINIFEFLLKQEKN